MPHMSECKSVDIEDYPTPMSERADLRLPCEHGRYEEHATVVTDGAFPYPYSTHHTLRHLCPGGRSLTDAEALARLLPDVDWEALRRMLEAWPNPEKLTALQQMARADVLESVARRLLAVYDGKDTP